ncbi:MAG: fructose-1,6-bisphosphatase [Eubacteriales bacterium]|nr:fructose-1,6-bisphosphatase [Eubacteriales bacterium]
MTTEYLSLLSEQYPTIASACAEIIKLQSTQQLPKLTEHFLSDIHGEYESFLHILRNASGVIKDKISSVFAKTMSESDRRTLATLIYYPEQKLEHIKATVTDLDDWYKITLYQLIEICRIVATKYTRADVRRALPDDYGDIIDELIHEDVAYDDDKSLYYASTIDNIIKLGQADSVIVAMSALIQRLAIGRLHIIGDIFDRGPRADIILDKLMSYHSVDIQWGNHDILWMGAAAGNLACIANTITTSTKYCNFDCIEDGYGINMRPLTVFALETYANDPCECFIPRNPNGVNVSQHDVNYWAKIHKAIAIIQFKLEGQILAAHPEFEMENHLLLDKIDFEKGTVRINDKDYPMLDTNLPTVDPESPYTLTAEEAELMEGLRVSFLHSEKLQKHIRFLFRRGSMYLSYNGNLLYHGCIPMNSDASFAKLTLLGENVSGKMLLDKCEEIARKGYFSKEGSFERTYGLDFMWYLWCGVKSPLYGKSKMTSFERYFLDDKETHIEVKNPYYTHITSREICEKILAEFGLKNREFSHIINGHVPVNIKKGESPIKAGGKLLVIDGGLSKAYQPHTGIAGYTLLFNSHGLLLSEHSAFTSVPDAVVNDEDIHSTLTVVEMARERLLVADTDKGVETAKKIDALGQLVKAYRAGTIKTL